MGNSNLKCCGCKEYFPRDRMVRHPSGWFHSIDCSISYAQAKSKKVRERQASKAKFDTKNKEKAVRAKHRADKERIKTKAKWLEELQALVNRYVRVRDAKDGCISCDKPATWKGQWHCSHFYPRGRSSKLRFNLWNMHKSCSVCNSRLSGNLLKYKPRLIEKIGQSRFNYLELHQNDLVSYDVEWIKRAKKLASKAIRLAEKRL